MEKKEMNPKEECGNDISTFRVKVNVTEMDRCEEREDVEIKAGESVENMLYTFAVSPSW
jgi:hypothetical protein